MSSDILHFQFPNVLPDMRLATNARRRADYWEQQKLTKEAKDQWYMLILSQKPQDTIPLDTVYVGFILHYKGKRKRDPDNILSALKPCIDALVLAGILAGDSSKEITTLSISVKVGEPQDATEIRIWRSE